MLIEIVLCRQEGVNIVVGVQMQNTFFNWEARYKQVNLYNFHNSDCNEQSTVL